MWESKNFQLDEYDDGVLAGEVRDFLNEKRITVFHVVQSSDGYLEIVYRLPEEL